MTRSPFSKLEVGAGAIHAEVLAGTHIETACDAAAACAAENHLPVIFTFNGVTMTVSPGQTGSAAVARWQAEGDARRREYEESLQGRAAAAQRVLDLQEHQARVKELIQRLPGVASDEALLMDWLYEFTDAADFIGSGFQPIDLLSQLMVAGWKTGAHVIKTDDPVLAAALRERITSNKRVMAEYIVGQVMSAAVNGMPPHPITKTFIDEYRAIAAQ